MANQEFACIDRFAADRLDRSPFQFRHRLMGHPALGLDNLAQVLPRLPESQVFYSSGLLKPSDDFDRAHVEHRNGLSLEATIETIRSSQSYIMVRSPETDASFRDLHAELERDLRIALRAAGEPERVYDCRLYLVIASPGSLTPFHFDRYSTLLMQFRGSKSVYVHEPWDPRVISQPDIEAYMLHAGGRPPWRDELEGLATRFDFHPGDGVHIPFVSGHFVRNGLDDVSISMSVIFNSERSMRQKDALNFNRRARAVLSPLHLEPAAVGQSNWRDNAKSLAWRGARGVARLLRPGVPHPRQPAPH